jgi:hypothetical protein
MKPTVVPQELPIRSVSLLYVCGPGPPTNNTIDTQIQLLETTPALDEKRAGFGYFHWFDGISARLDHLLTLKASFRSMESSRGSDLRAIILVTGL